MKKKILIGVGLYLAAGVATAAFLPSAKGLAILGKLEGVALWPLWIFTYATGRAGNPNASPGQSPVGTIVPQVRATTPRADVFLFDEGVRNRPV